MTLDELRCQRARDALALIDGQPAMLLSDGPRLDRRFAPARTDGGVVLRACSARELEWLAPSCSLVASNVLRTDTAPHAAYGIASPFMPSLLVVVYTARYFLAACAAVVPTASASTRLDESDASSASNDPATAPREVHIIYGALEAVEQPFDRSMGSIELR
jgi:hypothetical protein